MAFPTEIPFVSSFFCLKRPFLGVNLFVYILYVQTVVLLIVYNKSLCMHDSLNKCFAFVEETSIRTDNITQLKTGEKFQWNKVEGAKNYICRICGPDIECTSRIGDEPSLEIPYSALTFKSQKNKPDPVEVVIEVLAVGDNDVLGKGGNFSISKLLFCIRQQT